MNMSGITAWQNYRWYQFFEVKLPVAQFHVAPPPRLGALERRHHLKAESVDVFSAG